MELYNSLIRESNDLIGTGNCRTWEYYEKDAWNDVGTSELVLQKDAAFEMGAQGKGSANYILYTSSPELVNRDETVLYGKDICELNGNCDFARIVILRIGVLDAEDEVVYRTLKDIEFAKYHVYPEGYMVRMSPESYREQIRVSKDAIRRGISFRSVGARYIQEYKKDINVLSCKVIFITDPSFDYNGLQKLAKKSKDVTGTLTHILEGLPTDCSVCSLKGICDEVEGMKELHFGVGDKSDKH